MNRTDISFLACRILSIYIFYIGLRTISFISVQRMTMPDAVILATITGAIPFLILSSLAIIFWVFAGRFSRMILPKSDEYEETVSSFDQQEFFAAAFAVVGVIILGVSIPGLLRIIPDFILQNRDFYFAEGGCGRFLG